MTCLGGDGVKIFDRLVREGSSEKVIEHSGEQWSMRSEREQRSRTS